MLTYLDMYLPLEKIHPQLDMFQKHHIQVIFIRLVPAALRGTGTHHLPSVAPNGQRSSFSSTRLQKSTVRTYLIAHRL